MSIKAIFTAIWINWRNSGYTKENSFSKWLKSLPSRSCDGFLTLRLVWEGLNIFNEWRQTSNPAIDTSVANFTRKKQWPFMTWEHLFVLAIMIGYPNGFIGLYLSSDGIKMLAGQASGHAFSIGAHTNHISGLPGPLNDLNSIEYVDKVELFVKPECYQTLI